MAASIDGATDRPPARTSVQVRVTGHTAGSLCLVLEAGARPSLVTGDTLFARGTGRCALPGSSRARARASLRTMLAPRPDDMIVRPGHGGTTTVGRERGLYLSEPTLAA